MADFIFVIVFGLLLVSFAAFCEHTKIGRLFIAWFAKITMNDDSLFE